MGKTDAEIYLHKLDNLNTTRKSIRASSNKIIPSICSLGLGLIFSLLL